MLPRTLASKGGLDLKKARSGLTPLGAALGDTLKELRLEGQAREMAALMVWSEVVGPQIAAVTEPDTVRDGVLHVIARTSTWASELTFHKQSILKGLNQRLGKGTLRDLRFHQGRLSSAPAGTDGAALLPTPEQLAAVALSEEDERDIGAAVAAQPDPELQAVVGRIVEGERRRRRWFEQQGERVCPGCGALYRRAGAECPACRMERRQS
jgi:predicted nucleic acid-binding Zn ribbon protein